MENIYDESVESLKKYITLLFTTPLNDRYDIFFPVIRSSYFSILMRFMLWNSFNEMERPTVFWRSVPVIYAHDDRGTPIFGPHTDL